MKLHCSFSQEAKWNGTEPADRIYGIYILLEQKKAGSVYNVIDSRQWYSPSGLIFSTHLGRLSTEEPTRVSEDPELDLAALCNS